MEVAGGEDGLDPLALAQRQDVHQRAALRRARRLGQLVDLRAVHLAAVGEEEQEVVRRAHEEVLDVVAVLHVHPGHADAAAPLLAVRREREGLDVAALRDRDDHLLVGDQVLDVELVLARRDLRAPLVGEARGDLLELLLDDAQHAQLVAEDRPQLADALRDVGVLVLDRVRLERGELQPGGGRGSPRPGSPRAEAVHELRAGRVAVAAAADELDDRVEVVERDEQALEDVGARLLLGQLELRAADDDLALVGDVGAEDLAQRQRPRDAVDQGDGVDPEGRLHRRVLVEVVQHDLGQRVALELDDQAHAVAVGLVPQVGDVRDLLVVDELGDLLDERALAALLDHEGQLGDDDRLLALGQRLGVGARAHADAAAAGLVGVADALPAEDDPARREVGALDVLHQLLDGDRRVVDERDDRVGDLAEVVRRDVRGHADGDARRAVDEEVREPRRQDERLLLAPVVVRHEVDRVHVDVAQHLGGQPGQPGLRVPHRRRGVVVDRAEVALAVDERVAHGELLRHADERVVDRRVAVRVVVAHHVADDAGALRVRPGRAHPALGHREQDAPVDRLEPVADVGQRPAHDDGHRVVEVGRAHLVLEGARLDVPSADDVGGSHALGHS